jgi:hypothetical protein
MPASLLDYTIEILNKAMVASLECKLRIDSKRESVFCLYNELIKSNLFLIHYERNIAN